ncbi:MAG: hypothetical protein LQ352_004465 [Teloschistes flavicans]|nr:MAG: hypothetical protein LQ352_004465 [Teloschistes flavicans]
MANHEQPYDPYIPGQGASGHTTQHAGQDNRTAALQANIQRTEERGTNIEELRDKSDILKDHSHQFQRGANRVMKQMKWKNMRMWMWIILGVVVFIVVIALAVHFGKK